MLQRIRNSLLRAPSKCCGACTLDLVQEHARRGDWGVLVLARSSSHQRYAQQYLLCRPFTVEQDKIGGVGATEADHRLIDKFSKYMANPVRVMQENYGCEGLDVFVHFICAFLRTCLEFTLWNDDIKGAFKTMPLLASQHRLAASGWAHDICSCIVFRYTLPFGAIGSVVLLWRCE